LCLLLSILIALLLPECSRRQRLLLWHGRMAVQVLLLLAAPVPTVLPAGCS
jgi:hypothetical protein